ncbi:MAG: aspartate/glutamate racemase family protein [Beijerinckiaceae bacterium]
MIPRATIGVLMLDTTFERFPGDIGHEATFDFPVMRRTVPAATAARITALDDASYLEPFAEAGLALARDGADAIATSCGFLALYQRELAARLPVPVATSSLLQGPMIERTLPKGRRVGVLTFSSRTLDARHLAAAGCAPDTPLAGLPEGGDFQRAILGELESNGFDRRESEAVTTARSLTANHPDVGAILLECTNLVPHAQAIARATRLPVFDVVTLLNWLEAGLRPRSFLRAHA